MFWVKYFTAFNISSIKILHVEIVVNKFTEEIEVLLAVML